MKGKNTNIIGNIANPQNQEPNNQYQLEILACDETLQDFEKYLLDRGFDEMINCITSNNKNEKKQFDKFFEYFGIITQNKQEDIINQNEQEDIINAKNKFIYSLKQYLQNIKNNTNQIEKKNQLLAIIAVALQNCKLRRMCGPESHGYTKEIGKNLISLLSQAQYFLRYAKDCKVAWKTRCFKPKGFIETNDAEYKTTDIIDANNFLYNNFQSQNMILTKTGETTNMEKLAEKHFSKISKTIYEKNKKIQENNHLNIETTIPTARLWGTEQNHIMLHQYSNQWNSDTNNNLRLTINTSDIDLLFNNEQDRAKKLGKNIRIYNYEENKFIISENNNNSLKEQELNSDQYPYNTNKQHTIYVNAGDHLAFTGNEGYMFFQNQQNISDRKYNNRSYFVSLDVNMASTEFFRFFGADGQLCHGFFTFNNCNNNAQNFQSLNMPNTFLFKGKTINARRFITDMNIMPKTIAPKINRDNIYNTFNSYNMSQSQQGKQNNNGHCDCLKQTCPCLKKCF